MFAGIVCRKRGAERIPRRGARNELHASSMHGTRALVHCEPCLK
jgi:hypothetical protein